MKKTIVIGITGGIGSGKSAVAQMFERLGAQVFDADRFCHDLLERPAVVRRLKTVFGEGVIESGGKLNRKALADAVFVDGESLAALTAILHPPAIKEIKRAVSRLRRGREAGVLAVDAALLMESGLDGLCDALVFVYAPFPVRASRVKRERDWSKKEISRREKFQLSVKEKKQKADYVIDNTHTRRQTLTQVRQVWRALFDRGIP